MDDVVKRYRKRRMKRLAKRFDADIEWITTESGLHIPLKGGVASSGPLKGKEFKEARSSGNGKKMGEKRKQIEVKNWKVEDDELEEFNKKAFKSIMDETGYSEEDAKAFHKGLLDYMGGDYEAFAKGKREDAERTIDNGLARMGAYDGEIYRGLFFPDYREKDFEGFAKMDVGSIMPSRSVTSWSSKKDVADGFASTGLAAGNSVVISCKNNKSGVGVQHISKFRGSEAEVLTPSTVRWKVVGKKIVSQYDIAKEAIEMYNKKENMSRWEKAELADMKVNLRQRRRLLRDFKTVILEVEEI